MPAAYLMAWEPTRRRWWKQYRGTRYVVSCRQLERPRDQGWFLSGGERLVADEEVGN